MKLIINLKELEKLARETRRLAKKCDATAVVCIEAVEIEIKKPKCANPVKKPVKSC